MPTHYISFPFRAIGKITTVICFSSVQQTDHLFFTVIIIKMRNRAVTMFDLHSAVY